jgi:hypothetical protein
MPGVLLWTVADHSTGSIEHALMDSIPERDKLRVPVSRYRLQLILKSLLLSEKCLHSWIFRTRPIATGCKSDNSLIFYWLSDGAKPRNLSKRGDE